MPRAAFDHTFTGVTGPGAPIPGQPVLPFYGRAVPVDNLIPRAGYPLAVWGWLTTEGGSLSAAPLSYVGGKIVIDVPVADIVFGPGLPVGGLVVLDQTYVLPRNGSPYTRYSLGWPA